MLPRVNGVLQNHAQLS